MKATPKLQDCDHVLVVEGYGDLLFYAEVLEHLQVDGVFIKHFNGAADLLAQLEAFLSSGLLIQKKSIAVILDADNDAAARIQSLSALLKRITHRTLRHGVWSQGQPNLGFYIVPDGRNRGEIESLVWQSWASDPANESQKNCIEAYLQCMSDAGCDSKSSDKGKISSLLAVHYDDDPRLGPGARAKVFDFDRPELKPLCDFLTQL